jgi:hypothetical protein
MHEFGWKPEEKEGGVRRCALSILFYDKDELDREKGHTEISS